jgi:hypothetical protein
MLLIEGQIPSLIGHEKKLLHIYMLLYLFGNINY